MQLKNLFLIALFFCAASAFGQNNFTFSPEKPQPGDVITISYSPAGDIANTTSPVEAVVYSMTSKGQTANDVKLKRTGNSYTGTVKIDTSSNFVYFGFSSNQKFDNNFNNGYWILLYNGDSVQKATNLLASYFYLSMGRSVGVDIHKEKALEYFKKEFEVYPEARKENLATYLSLLSSVDKENAPAMIQKEIEKFIKAGLKEESDYSTLQNLYSIAKLPQQASLINEVKKEKFPTGKWTINETVQKFRSERYIAKKEQMLDDIILRITNDPDWKYLESSLNNYKSSITSAYLAKEDWEGAKNSIRKYNIRETDLASLYNNTAWEIQKTDKSLKKAEEMSAIATQWAKNEWEKPTVEKPGYLTQKQWEKSRMNTYGMYADTYAMINYKLGNYKKGFPYAKESALEISKGESAGNNNTYALLAEKVLSPKKYVPELEQFVKEGKAAVDVKEILKRAYVKSNQSETGYEDYMAKLEKSSYEKMLEELRKGVLDDAAPQFSLLGLDGGKVNIADLKNKIVIVDFWATWCGPCKASFPAMQKMVTKYKDDPEVKFVFVDTWETNENKEKNAGDFIAANKYDFHVLMDNESKVVEQFKVEGIPTKFVIDKSGTIRFKSVGFGGSNDKLISELSAMIDMAKQM
jgi:thiol-disulfide isomerase/thioredoxin